MDPPPGWVNPIRVASGQMQAGIDANVLLPSRRDLSRARLDSQRQLHQSQTVRHTPIQVTLGGVIWDGHHAVRVAAEEEAAIDVFVVSIVEAWSGLSILQLPVR